MEIVGNIYSETDYSKFKRLECNRIISKTRFNKILESFNGGVILTPITVNGKMEIIDGQGRFEVRKYLGLPILYVIDEMANIDDCRRINYANTPWKTADFVESYANGGNENYIRLADVAEYAGVKYVNILRLVNKKTRDVKAEKDLLKSGELVFTEHDKKVSMAYCDKFQDIRTALNDEKKLNDAFWVACKVMVDTDGYNHTRMIELCNKLRMRYSQQARLEDQLKMFSTIYNGGRYRTNLYFEDYLRNKGRNVRDYRESHFKDDREDISTL